MSEYLPKRIIRRRIAALFFIITGIIFMLSARLMYIQIFQHERYTDHALQQRLRPIPVDARRGTIYDALGRELAISVSADAVYVNPAEIIDKEGVAREIAETLVMDYEVVLQKVNKNVATEWISRKVLPHKIAELREKKLHGVGFAERAERFYPKDTLAAHILGIAGIDNQGLEGIEVFYEHYLAGIPGWAVVEKDAIGRDIPDGLRMYIPPEEGYDLYLTIDEVIQYITERELAAAVEETGSKRGMAIIMNPQTGEILAMANVPTFDPNNYNDFPTVYRRNIALSDSYEPGSTFKIVTAAAALEEKLVTPEETFYDPGYIKVEDRTLRCWTPGGHGHQTFMEAVENSCNVVFVTLGLRLDKETFYKYIDAFGFGSRLSIDYPGEARGILMPVEGVGPVEQGNIAFGQGISITPLQLLSAASAIANGGRLMQPMIAKEVRDSEGNMIQSFEPKVIRQVISQETADLMKEILESVVVNGSGRNAQIDGYRVAGKTGTAQKPEDGRYGEERVASFVGFLPVSDPQFVGIIILDEPSVNPKYGGMWAAPVFQRIMTDVLKYREIAPDEPGVQRELEAQLTIVPNVVGLFVEDAVGLISRAGLSYEIIGNHNTVTHQVPEAGFRVERGTQVDLYVEETTESPDLVSTPDVYGMSITRTSTVLSEGGLSIDIRGSGFASRQDPAPGEMVKRGTRIIVYFEGKED